jgi:hypothetical protein
MVDPDRIKSLKDLSMAKQRLRIEIMKTESTIHSSYREIIQAFTFKNIAGTMINDMTTRSAMLTKAFAIGKSFFSKRKKKKHDKMKEVIDDTLS